jgi:hypothetical protein
MHKIGLVSRPEEVRASWFTFLNISMAIPIEVDKNTGLGRSPTVYTIGRYEEEFIQAVNFRDLVKGSV